MIERLIYEMEALELKIQDKREKQKFVNEVIAEKQRQCQQAKEQHEERIRALARQARRQRGRRNPSSQRGAASLLPPCEAGGAAAAAASAAATFEALAASDCGARETTPLDLDAIDASLGRIERLRLLPGDHALSDNAAGLAALRRALESRLLDAGCLNVRLEEHEFALKQATEMEDEQHLRALLKEIEVSEAAVRPILEETALANERT